MDETYAPSELTDKQMEDRLGRKRGKLELAALDEGTYKREGDRWYLLDARG